MSLRLRFALWYAGLTAAVVVALAFAAYVVHGRALYADVDRTLVGDAALVAPVLALIEDGSTPFRPPPLEEGTAFVRAYDADGNLLAVEAGLAGPPPISVAETFQADDGPAHDGLIGLVWPANVTADGAFATVRRTPDGPRTRVYVVEARSVDGRTGYVQSWASLRNVDHSMARFRWMLAVLGTVGVLLSAGGSAALTGRALRPIATLTATARVIADRRDFGRRVAHAADRDELGQLASTVNSMLDALEEAHETQRRFVADAAHELRAPLTTIRGNVDLLASHGEMSEDDRQEALEALQAQARWLGHLVDELLLLARSDAGQSIVLRPTDLDRAVLDAVREVEPAQRGRVRLEEVESVVVLGDGDRLRQLTTILLDNALKYSGTDPVRVSIAASGGRALLTVSDRGPGVSAQDLPHVFERFYRGDPARSRAPGGAGLGLPIAHWIVEQHHGDIALHSRPGEGATVTVSLPLAGAEGVD